MKHIYKKILSSLLIFAVLLPALTFVSYGFEIEDSVKVLYEEESRRTENTKHFVCSNGSMFALAYPVAVHYRSEDGSYQEIDNRLSYNSATKCYENIDPTTNSYMSVVNKTHYKFGTKPQGYYVDGEIEPKDPTVNNIGGRDLILSYDSFYKLYIQRYHYIFCKE